MKKPSYNSLNELLESRAVHRHQIFEQYIDPWKVRGARHLQTDCKFTRAQGAYLYDEAEVRYLDFDAGNGVFAIGRNHPVARSVMHELLDLSPPNMVDREIPLLAGLLAETLVKYMPKAAHRVLFASTGSEAVEAALKFSRVLTGRPRFLFLEGDYHGATYGAMSVTGVPFISDKLEPMLPGCDAIPRNDLERLEKELAQGDVAGFIIEPIQGLEVRPLDQAYVQRAQHLCRQYETAFIVDEVFTGFGRTGCLFATEHFNVEPDLLVVAKALGAGYVPVGGVIIRNDLYNKVFDRPGIFVHGSSFEFNDYAMAAGLATLKVLDQENLVENARKNGELLAQGLEELKERYDMIDEVRGKGLLLGIQLKAPESLRLRASGRLMEKRGLLGHMLMVQLLAKHQIITAAVSRTNILRLTPPLLIDKSQIHYFLESLSSVLKDAYRFPDGIGRFAAAQFLRSLRT